MSSRWKKPAKDPEPESKVPENQMSMFDVAEQKKSVGIAAAYRGANVEWKKAAEKYLRKLVEKKRFITSEEVVLYLKNKGIITGENRAMGAIMQSFARAGLIEHYGFSVSKRPECHKSPVRIWKSRIYREN